MPWFTMFLVALLTGMLGLFVAGGLAALCIDWYDISPREGGAGFVLIAAALLGAALAFAIGLIAPRVFGGAAGMGFLKALGLGWAIVIGLGLAGLVLAYARADIPPKIAGRRLMFEVELRLPAGGDDPRRGDAEAARFSLASSSGGVQRATRQGELKFAQVRRDGARWVVPAAAFLFTQRGERSFDMTLPDGRHFGFSLPLPARPDQSFEGWSGWYPQPRAGDPPWPEGQAMFRFRVQRIQPPVAEPDPDEAQAEAFAALTAAAPLQDWLAFQHPDAPAERSEAIRLMVQSRQDELARLIGGNDARHREAALIAAAALTQASPAVLEAVRAEGRAIAGELRRLNTLARSDPAAAALQDHLRGRFGPWLPAWWTVSRLSAADTRAPVQEIHDLAQAQGPDSVLSDVVANASAVLNGLAAQAR